MDLRQAFQMITYASNINANIGALQMFSRLPGPQSIPEVQNRFSYTQQAVQLLTQEISRRTSWEHEKLLFFSQYDEQDANEKNQNKLCHELVSQNNQEPMELKGLIKLNSIQEIKTPDLLPDLESKIVDNFILQNKKYQKPIKIKKVHCNCKKSKCLKMYCQCFQNGEICEGCACCDCKNTQLEAEQRIKAVQKVQEKQPAAFMKVFKYKGCRCNKTNCQKGYCQCFAQGLICGKYCLCMDCNNCSNYMKNKQKRYQQKVAAKKRA